MKSKETMEIESTEKQAGVENGAEVMLKVKEADAVEAWVKEEMLANYIRGNCSTLVQSDKIDEQDVLFQKQFGTIQDNWAEKRVTEQLEVEAKVTVHTEAGEKVGLY